MEGSLFLKCIKPLLTRIATCAAKHWVPEYELPRLLKGIRAALTGRSSETGTHAAFVASHHCEGSVQRVIDDINETITTHPRWR